MNYINAYAATSATEPLKPFSFDPGELGLEEVEIKVSHCGVCHSDLSMLDNEWRLSKYPFVPGHEVVGTVVALGEEAKGLEIGQRVGLNFSARHSIAPTTEMFPMSKVNDAIEHLRAGKARYRIVLENDLA
jgi:uncharacterized zinc-type alcohol dehydrogenase-like protein